MSMCPVGLCVGRSSPSCVRPSDWPAARRSGRLERLRARRGGGLAPPCSLRGPSGSASSATAVGASGARFRSDAKRGGVVRAASTRARTKADMPGPSATLPPSAASWASSPVAPPLVGPPAPWRSAPVAASRLSATATFICGG
eukprot:2731715-Pleurochrysis_carterae.AAC.2